MSALKKLKAIHRDIEACRLCPKMCGNPVHGEAIMTSVMLVGQAPGPHEEKFGKPFAYTAGKTLFRWFEQIGANEESFRKHVYIAAAARCFPGKDGKGDRVPSKEEIQNCSRYLISEVEVLKPELILAIGRLAIGEVLGEEVFSKKSKLTEVIGKRWTTSFYGRDCEVICFPHPSGLSRWTHSEEGKKLLKKSLTLVKNHPAWIKLFQS